MHLSGHSGRFSNQTQNKFPQARPDWKNHAESARCPTRALRRPVTVSRQCSLPPGNSGQSVAITKFLATLATRASQIWEQPTWTAGVSPAACEVDRRRPPFWDVPCHFCIASEDSTIPLDSVDDAFDEVAPSVAESVIVALLLAKAARRDDRLDLFGCEQFSKWGRIVVLIGNSRVKMERGENEPAWEI